MKEEQHFTILEIIFKLLGGGVTPVASSDYDSDAKDRLETLLSIMEALLDKIRDLANRFANSSFFSCEEIGKRCEDFLKEQELIDRENDWISINARLPDKTKMVEVLLKNGHIMNGNYDGKRWFVYDGFVCGWAEGDHPMYSSSVSSDNVRYWRNYKLPHHFEQECDEYTL